MKIEQRKTHSVFFSICLREAEASFLARDSVYAIARYVLSPVRPSVRLSVRRTGGSKTVEVRITQSSLQSSPLTLVS